MSVFGRKKRRDDDDADDAVAADETADVEAPPPPPPTTGPWDVADVDDETTRVDLGGLRVPVPDGIEVRVDVNPEGEVVAAVVLDRGSSLQLNAFAAPKRLGIWDEVRGEIQSAVREQSGSADQVDGTFGPELSARVSSGPGTTSPARFIGVDGPRWFLRGLLTGPAATDPPQAKRLEDVFRGVVVIRGGEAMAPRDPIPLHLPREAVEQAEKAASAAAAGQAAGEGDDAAGDGDSGERESADGEPAENAYKGLNPFERGPEITEIH